MKEVAVATRRLAVRRDRFGEWLDRLRRRGPSIDGVERSDDCDALGFRVALPGFTPREIEVEIAPDHLLIDAIALRAQRVDSIGTRASQADVHLLLPFPEAVDCDQAAARLRSGVLTVRAPRRAAQQASSP
jgi:HSP20 family protein